MKRGLIWGEFVLFGLTMAALALSDRALAQEPPTVNWIWFNEGDPAQEAPAEVRYFRKVFEIKRTVDEASLDITADNAFEVWLNGVKIGQGNDWKRVHNFDVKKHLVQGKNVVAVKATNTEGAAGLLVRLPYVPTGTSREVIVGDASWKSSKTAVGRWHDAEYDDSKWSASRVIGAYGHAGPWKGLAWDSGGDDRFAVPAGFVVEQVARNPNPADPFSLVNLTFDNKGRLLISKENGPVLLCSGPVKNGVFQTIKPYCDQVHNCQGMCWVDDALLLVGNGPQGTGLYRVRDTRHMDRTDSVEVLHRFVGGMGEHGPHAIFHGPDNWLYLIVGNHAWAHPDKLAVNSPLTRWPHGLRGPDQDQPHTTQDVLLPRLDDAHHHADGILAPGGTIWRLDRQGKHMSMVTAGFRNAFDAAFSPDGELFTFDSDMEWDEALPWYRPVRVCHCPPGAEFGWRNGASKLPAYALDTLPATLDVGRGSPVGLEFYDHNVFPKKYHGAFFMADWSLGVIYAVFLEKHGASYTAKIERFCVGNPMNVTDIVVGPDGSLYFTMGGRGSHGGVYRITYRNATKTAAHKKALDLLIDQPQPRVAWSKAQIEALRQTDKESNPATSLEKGLYDVADNPKRSARERVRALDLLQNHWGPMDNEALVRIANHAKGDVREHAIWLLGVNEYQGGREVLLKALQDHDARVRRLACEALIRAQIEPRVEDLWLLLGDKDQFLRTAARLVLQRIDPKKWAHSISLQINDAAALEMIVALCKIDRAEPNAKQIFDRLLNHKTLNANNPAIAELAGDSLTNILRTIELVLIHTSSRPESVHTVARKCFDLFPNGDWRANRELANLLVYFRSHHLLEEPVHGKLLDVLLAEKDRQQQIHYFYCLRFLHEGWTPEQKHALLTWYDSTKGWEGGFSFTPFLENILHDLNPIFTAQDRTQVLSQWQKQPWAAVAMIRLAPPQDLPAATSLTEIYEKLLTEKPLVPKGQEFKDSIVEVLGQAATPEAQSALRRIAGKDPARRDEVARTLARTPTPANWPYLVRGLESGNPILIFDVIDALRKIPSKPKAEDAAPFRLLLLASNHLNTQNRWKVVELLRQWTNDKQFGADAGDWKSELTAWGRWFGQTFPKEPELPNLGSAQSAAASKYHFADLLAFLEKDPAGRKGDAARGRVVFEKAQCLKCHKFGKEGEGIGPDLTTVSKRFKRIDILESIYYPSKVISDQYRSTMIVTKKGQQINGLALPQGDAMTVLQSDGTKMTLKKTEIEQQFASLVSVMPEKLLDPLTMPEIADLFAFMESNPN